MASGTNNGIVCADATINNLTRVVNDGTTSSTWTHVRAQSGSNWTNTITPPQLPYDSAPNQTVLTFDSSGEETSRKIYQGSAASGTLLRTVNTTWSRSALRAGTLREFPSLGRTVTKPLFYSILTQL